MGEWGPSTHPTSLPLLTPPPHRSSYFDKVISDSSFVISSIDPLLGWGAVDAGYANVTAHEGWVIPWMEDDMGLAGAQLWVNRTLWHGDDAAAYGAKGLLGLLWRTFETSPQIAALAAAGWGSSVGANLTTASIYTDFCATNFGAETAAVCAALFGAIDGTADPTSPAMENSRLPRGGQGCCGGPLSPTGEEGPVVPLNTSGFDAWLPTVTGAANRERAGRWVALFDYHRQLANVSLTGQALVAAAAQVHDAATAREYGFPALAALTAAYSGLVTALLSFTTSPGELGMLAAHEGMNWPSNFFRLDDGREKAGGCGIVRAWLLSSYPPSPSTPSLPLLCTCPLLQRCGPHPPLHDGLRRVLERLGGRHLLQRQQHAEGAALHRHAQQRRLLAGVVRDTGGCGAPLL